MRIYLYLSAVVSAVIFLYVWHYRPMSELEDTKKENVKLKEDVKAITVEVDTISFESKHKAIKDTLQAQKKEYNNEINTTIGHHTITIE